MHGYMYMQKHMKAYKLNINKSLKTFSKVLGAFCCYCWGRTIRYPNARYQQNKIITSFAKIDFFIVVHELIVIKEDCFYRENRWARNSNTSCLFKTRKVSAKFLLSGLYNVLGKKFRTAGERPGDIKEMISL